MKKKLVMFVIAGICFAAVARKCVSMCSSETEQSSESEKPTKSDRMRARMERLPEGFPPRVMFENVQTARDNTERILELLEAGDVRASEAGDVRAPEAEALAGALL